MENRVWQLQEAKNKFSRLVEKAQKNGPQIVTKHGKEAVVVLSVDEYKKMITPKCDLVEFIQKSPLKDAKIDFSELRSKDLPRDLEI
ncbi:MAG: type II toxin-antitoxin system Phd/YefM family antitoxin [Deltaproteobacteria bacterium]|nr:type II toxin-antitoxin system Phd/YefM family antitoxin [Deltaproteobacteria bacterium]MBW2017751.1 type II toxin-antitoxin system Phd/YefM family antitoxin [Deltaproteobacteria bacterium]MBW2305054.1 type II toxin-antitoxin system Phd/YefM family antitoxin [Deltaproteobacteria bacterium]